jgi:hypothetical protein
LLDSQVKSGAFVDQSIVDSGVLQNDWFTILADDGVPYLKNAECGELQFLWTDPRFAFAATFNALENARQWLSENGLSHAVPTGLQVRVSETQSASQYDATTRLLNIGSRQCAEEICACDAEILVCPSSANGRAIWPHAQDGDIVVHEYGHAVLHKLVCRDVDGCVLPVGKYVTAMDEAFSDYLASAVGDSQFKLRNDPFCLGEWYNSFQRRKGQCLRRMDSDLHWPEVARALRQGLPYSYSSVWASALFKARFLIPADSMDRIVFEAYSGLHSNMTFEQMANRIVVASRNEADGVYENIIQSILGKQGFLVDIAPLTSQTFEGQFQAHSSALNSWQLSAYPAFDSTQTLSVSGATAIRVKFQDIRLKHGDCIDAACGRIYLSNANGQLFQVISGEFASFTSVTIPGDTAVLRFIASFDHPRTTNYRIVGAIVQK